MPSQRTLLDGDTGQKFDSTELAVGGLIVPPTSRFARSYTNNLAWDPIVVGNPSVPFVGVPYVQPTDSYLEIDVSFFGAVTVNPVDILFGWNAAANLLWQSDLQYGTVRFPVGDNMGRIRMVSTIPVVAGVYVWTLEATPVGGGAGGTMSHTGIPDVIVIRQIDEFTDIIG